MGNNIKNENRERIEQNEDKNIIIPDNFTFLYNITNSYSRFVLDNTFTIINLNNMQYIIYSTLNKSIISYNFNKEKIETEIKNAHKKDITNFRNYYKRNKNKYIIMSISGDDKNIKLWDFKNWDCILNLPFIYKYGLIFSSCFFIENNKEYILSSGSADQSQIKMFDFSGNFIKIINNSEQKTLFIDYLYDEKISKYYIITGNHGYIKSYDYNDNKLYHKYQDSGISWHCSVKQIFSQNIIKLIDSCWEDDNIRIWDFHLGILLDKIRTYGQNIKSIYIYNKNYIFVACQDKTFRLIDIKNKNVIKNLKGHKDSVCCINKLVSSKYGECLITQGLGRNEMIKIWSKLN